MDMSSAKSDFLDKLEQSESSQSQHIQDIYDRYDEHGKSNQQRYDDAEAKLESAESHLVGRRWFAKDDGG